MVTPTTTNTNLFTRLGGVQALRSVVDDCYQRILDDSELAIFFESTNLAKLKLHQVKFLKLALSSETGMQNSVAMRDKILRVHAHMFQTKGLNEYHFDRVAGHLVDALQACGVQATIIAQVQTIVLPLRVVFCNAARDVRNGKDVVVLSSGKQPSNGVVSPAAIVTSPPKREHPHPLAFKRGLFSTPTV